MKCVHTNSRYKQETGFCFGVALPSLLCLSVQSETRGESVDIEYTRVKMEQKMQSYIKKPSKNSSTTKTIKTSEKML